MSFQFLDVDFVEVDGRGDGARKKVMWLEFPCQGKSGSCHIAIRPNKNIVGASWEWDGDWNAPTICPSVNCEQVCGWHGFIVRGKFQ